MPEKQIVLIFYILLVGVIIKPTLCLAGWFGPNNYEECILENMKEITSDQAARLISKACQEKFPQKTKHSDKSNIQNLEFLEFDDILGIEHRDLTTKELQNLSVEKGGYNKFTKMQEYTIHNGNNNLAIIKISIEISNNSVLKTYSVNVYIEPQSVSSFYVKLLENDSYARSWSISKALGRVLITSNQ